VAPGHQISEYFSDCGYIIIKSTNGDDNIMQHNPEWLIPKRRKLLEVIRLVTANRIRPVFRLQQLE